MLGIIPKKFLFTGVMMVGIFVMMLISVKFTQTRAAPLGSTLARAVQESNNIVDSIDKKNKNSDYDKVFREFWEAQVPPGEKEFTWLR